MNPDRPIIDFSFGRTLSTGFMTFLARVLVSIPYHILYALRIRGRSNLRAAGRGGFVTVSNHCLYSEPVFAGMAVWPRRLWYCAEQANVDRRYLGWLCRLMGAFGIPDDKPLSIMGPVREALKRKQVIHIYPEGELYFRNQDIAPFYGGACYFALAAGVPILPMTAVLRTRKAWRLLPWLPPRVEYVIGPAIHPRDYIEKSGSRKEALEAFSNAVRSAMQDVIDERGGERGLPGASEPGRNMSDESLQT